MYDERTVVVTNHAFLRTKQRIFDLYLKERQDGQAILPWLRNIVGYLASFKIPKGKDPASYICHYKGLKFVIETNEADELILITIYQRSEIARRKKYRETKKERNRIHHEVKREQRS